MNTWTRRPLAQLGQGLEISYARADENRAPHLHLGLWPNGTHRKWSGWISPAQLYTLFHYLADHPELMEAPPEPEEGPDPSDPWA